MKPKWTIYRLPVEYPQANGGKAMYYSTHLFGEETKFHSEPFSRDFLGLLFNLGSEIKIQVGISHCTVARNQFSILYLPKGCCDLTVTAGKHDAFYIQFDSFYLKKIMEIFPILDGFLKNVEATIPRILNGEHLVITPKIRAEIKDVIHNDYVSRSREMYLESKFGGIIIESLVNRKKNWLPGFDDTEINKIRQAYVWITENVKAHHTVGIIADKLDIDKRKLGKGFRLLFNTTVHSFVIDERLKIAIRLLRDTRHGIGNIAKTVGYSNRKTFTKLFKRKFGHPPITLVRNHKGYEK
jgi:AraC-like DNA-binding protein